MGKVKIFADYVIKAQRGRRGMAPLIRNLSCIWKWIVDFTLRPKERAPATYWVGVWVGPRASQDGFCRRIENVLSRLERIEGSCIYFCTDMYFTYFVGLWTCREGFLGQAACVTARWLRRLSSATVVVPVATFTDVFAAADMRSSHTIYITWLNVTCRLLQTCCLHYCGRNILPKVDLFWHIEMKVSTLS